MAQRPRVLARFLGLAVLVGMIVGCGDPAENPARLLTPSIRASDLLGWVRDAGVDESSIDWPGVDRAHDAYLQGILSERVAARQNITQLFRPIVEEEDTSPQRHWTTAKRSAAIAQNFGRSLAASDDAFLRSLASVRGISHDIAEYLVVRRALDRLAQRFRLAQIRTPWTTSLPMPVEWALHAWPSQDPRATDAIVAWTIAAGSSLVQLGEQLWSTAVTAAIETLEPLPDREDSEKAALQSGADLVERMKRITASYEPTASAFTRTSLDVLEPPTMPSASLIPLRAREAATARVLGALHIAEGSHDLKRLYNNAINLPGISGPLRSAVEAERDRWRANLRELARRVPPTSVEVVNAATAAREKLLALFPDDGTRAAIEAKDSAPRLPQVEVDEDTLPEAFGHYQKLVLLGALPRPPSRRELRELASLSGLDAVQARLFVDDSIEVWLDAMQPFDERIGAVEKAFGDEAISAVRRPGGISALISHAIAECVDAPLAEATRSDSRIGSSLSLRAESLRGSAEPAATIWAALRSVPDGGREWSNAQHNELRYMGSVALGGAAALAIDPQLSAPTRRVLADLVVEHRVALLDEASVVRRARTDALRELGMIIGEFHEDQRRGKAAISALVVRFLAATAPYTALNTRIVDRACELLPHDDALALRHRRATLRFPEMLAHGSNAFCRTTLAAHALGAESSARFGLTLERDLQLDDLALVDSVMSALEERPGAQPSAAELTRLSVEREDLNEQSLRRLDRAARAARDAARAPR